MKRMLIYITLLVAAVLAPVERVSLGDLRPVEVLAVEKTDNMVIMQTDTGDKGTGRSVTEALDDMKRTSLGKVYLDTTRYLLIKDLSGHDLQLLHTVLKDKVRICIAAGRVDLVLAAQYLDNHGKPPTLAQWQRGAKLPVLVLEK